MPESSIRMMRPVRAGDTASIEWAVSSVDYAPKLKGWIVTLQGQLVRDDGVVALRGHCKSVVYPS
jgi:acyl dehydratase